MLRTNSTIDVEWALTTDFDTKVNTLLASGDLPDVIMGYGNMSSLIDQGAIVPLDDYLTQDIAPNILAQLNDADYPYLRSVLDGAIYAFPTVFDFPSGQSWFLRKDWLDKLGMEVPATWEEWLAVWQAIADEDVNGNGDKTDELPITGGVALLMPAFGINHGFSYTGNNNLFTLMPDGGYGFVYDHPNYRAFLEAMADLYARGIMDQEFATRDMSASYKVMDSDLGFCTWGFAEQAKLSNQALLQGEGKADAEIICVAPPMGPFGDQMIQARDKVGARGVITIAGEEKAENIVRFFDWMHSEEGATLINYGVEGIHHEVVDGKPMLKVPYVNSFVEARGAGMIFQPFPFLWLEDSYMQILLTGKAYDELDNLTKTFYDGLFLNEPYFAYAPQQLIGTEAYADYGADLVPAVRELQAKTITGKLSVDDFFTQYEALKPQGLNAILEETVAAWAIINE